MATPITPTPILYGASSERFNKMLLSEQDDRVSDEERNRIVELVKKVLSNSNVDDIGSR